MKIKFGNFEIWILFEILYLFLAFLTREKIFFIILGINTLLFFISIVVRIFKYKYENKSNYVSSSKNKNTVIDLQFYKIIWCYYNIDNMLFSDPLTSDELDFIRDFLSEIARQQGIELDWVKDFFELHLKYMDVAAWAISKIEKKRKGFKPSQEIINVFREYKKTSKKYIETKDNGHTTKTIYNKMKRYFYDYYNLLLDESIKI